MENVITCPICGETGSVEKVSVLYLTGLSSRRSAGSVHRKPETGSNPSVHLDHFIPNIASLSQKLAPPSSGKQVLMRSIHPDMIVLAFSLIVPFFLSSIYRSQSGSLIPIIVVLCGFYVLYIWQRKNLIKKFDQQQARRKADAERTQRAIARWMRLYYCAKDEVVFETGVEQSAPIDQMMGFLYQAE